MKNCGTAVTHLLPLFNWDNKEAKNVWEGFLWSPRIYVPLLISIKEDFLETAHYYSQLGEYKNQYIRFLTFVALNNLDGYALSDFVDVFDELPQEALNEAAHALVDYIEANKDQREEHWKSNVEPYRVCRRVNILRDYPDDKIKIYP